MAKIINYFNSVNNNPSFNKITCINKISKLQSEGVSLSIHKSNLFLIRALEGKVFKGYAGHLQQRVKLYLVKMKKNIPLLLILLFLTFCVSKNHNNPDKLKSKKQPLTSVKLNLKSGYHINSYTGDSILPVINSMGDTVITGKPVMLKERLIITETVLKPEIIHLDNPKVVQVKSNIHVLPDKFPVVHINKNKLTSFTVGIDTSSYIFINSIGDTLVTGMPVSFIGKKVVTNLPVPKKASPPTSGENTSYNIKHIDVDQGLNSSSIMAVHKDSHGNIWYGTMGAGVTRFNGQSYTHFTEKEGLSNNNVLSILEDKNGNIWFGTEFGGVNMYNGDNFTHFTVNEGLSNNNVTSIIEDHRGNIWFGTEGGGACMYDGERLTIYTIKEGLSSNNIRSILEDRNNNLWFGTNGNGISKFDGEKFTHYTAKDGLPENYILSIMEDGKGNIWFGTFDEGVVKFDGNSFTQFSKNEGLSANTVASLLEDKDGSIWIGTIGGGVCKFNGKEFTYFIEKEGASNIDVIAMLEDLSGNIWFGTWGNGVYVYNKNSFVNYTEADGLSQHDVWSMLNDKYNNMWLGTFKSGLTRFDGNSFSQLMSSAEGDDFNTWSIFNDSNNNIWLGTDQGLRVFKNSKALPSQYTKFSIKNGLSSNIVTCGVEDNSGNIWLGTNGGGLNIYNGETFTILSDKDGLSCNNITAIIKDRNNNLWIGTKSAGIILYDGKSFTFLTEKEGLSSNNIQTIYESRNGNIWIGTENRGICIYNGTNFGYFSDLQGLSSNKVQSFIEDTDENMWIGTEKGLNLLVLDKNTNYTNYNFDKLDGLRSNAFYQGCVTLDNENRIWWGTGKSMSMLDLNSFNVPSDKPVIKLDRIEINDQFIDFRNISERDKESIQFSNVARYFNYPNNLELSPKYNHINFYFSAIDQSASNEIKYSFKIEGLNDWSIPSAEANAEYRGIPYGKYKFQVRAIGKAQKWSEPFEYSFTILPPWWHTWWARMGYIIIIILIIIVIVSWRTASLKKRQKELDKANKELQELDKAKNNFLNMISHELRTPLNGIVGATSLLNDTLGSDSELGEFVEMLHISVNRLENFSTTALLITQLQTNNQIKKEPFNVSKCLETVVDSNKENSNAKNISFNFDIHDSLDIIANPELITRAINCIVDNAIKYSNMNGIITISLFVKKDEIVIEVCDNGRGFTKAARKNLFKPFSLGEEHYDKNVGLSLKLAKQIMEAHNGTIEVENISKGGARVSIKLPKES